MPLLPQRGPFGAELAGTWVNFGYKHNAPNGADIKFSKQYTD